MSPKDVERERRHITVSLVQIRKGGPKSLGVTRPRYDGVEEN